MRKDGRAGLEVGGRLLAWLAQLEELDCLIMGSWAVAMVELLMRVAMVENLVVEWGTKMG